MLYKTNQCLVEFISWVYDKVFITCIYYLSLREGVYEKGFITWVYEKACFIRSLML